MKILITGGGLIGSHAAWALSEKGHDVCIVDRYDVEAYVQFVVGRQTRVLNSDVTNRESLENVLSNEKPTCVVHTAGLMTESFERNAWIGLATNVVASIGLAKMCRDLGVARFVFASSLAVYDFADSNVRLSEQSPKTRADEYGLAKLYVEDVLRTLVTESFRIINLRFAGVFGFGPHHGGAWMSRKLQGLASQLLTADAATELVLESFGWNEYLYAEDAGSAVALAIEHAASCEGDTFNVGSSRVVSPNELSECFRKCFPGSRMLVRPIDSVALLPEFLLRKLPLDLALVQRQLKYFPAFSDFYSALAAMKAKMQCA